MIIYFNPASPGAYRIFSQDLLISDDCRFRDSLKMDYANLTLTLDPDGVSYNCESCAPLSQGRWGFGIRSSARRGVGRGG